MKPDLEAVREELRALPEEFVHVLDPEPDREPPPAQPSPLLSEPPNPSDVPSLPLPVVDTVTQASHGVLTPQPRVAEILGLSFTEEDRQQLVKQLGQARAEEIEKLLREQAAGPAQETPFGPPALPVAQETPAVSPSGPVQSPGEPAGGTPAPFPQAPVRQQPPADLPAWRPYWPGLEAGNETPFHLPALPQFPAPAVFGRDRLVPDEAGPAPFAPVALPEPVPAPPQVLGTADLGPAPPMLGPDDLALSRVTAPTPALPPEAAPPPLAWPALGAEDLADAAALAGPAEAPRAVPLPQPLVASPVLGESDLAGGPFGTPELPAAEAVPEGAGRRGLNPFAGRFGDAGEAGGPVPEFAGAGFGASDAGGVGDLVGLLSRIAEGVERLAEIVGQAQEAGGASFGGHPGRAGPGGDFGYDDDPETPASPSVDLWDLLRPGKPQDAAARPDPEAPKRQRRAAPEEV